MKIRKTYTHIEGDNYDYSCGDDVGICHKGLLDFFELPHEGDYKYDVVVSTKRPRHSNFHKMSCVFDSNKKINDHILIEGVDIYLTTEAFDFLIEMKIDRRDLYVWVQEYV